MTSALAESGILGEPEASADFRLTACERFHPPGRIQTGVLGVSNPIGASCVADGESPLGVGEAGGGDTDPDHHSRRHVSFSLLASWKVEQEMPGTGAATEAS